MTMRTLYKTKLCTYYLAGFCKHQGACLHAHSETELRPAPDFQKTKLCRLYEQGLCTNSECPRAHGFSELKGEFYKKKPCKYWATSKRCVRGDSCCFAHDTSAAPSMTRRQPPDDRPTTTRPSDFQFTTASSVTSKLPSTRSFTTSFAPLPPTALQPLRAPAGQIPATTMFDFSLSSAAPSNASTAVSCNMSVSSQGSSVHRLDGDDIMPSSSSSTRSGHSSPTHFGCTDPGASHQLDAFLDAPSDPLSDPTSDAQALPFFPAATTTNQSQLLPSYADILRSLATPDQQTISAASPGVAVPMDGNTQSSSSDEIAAAVYLWWLLQDKAACASCCYGGGCSSSFHHNGSPTIADGLGSTTHTEQLRAFITLCLSQ